MSKSSEKAEKLDTFYCKSVAQSLGDILRFSLNEDFRKQSFTLFSANSASQTEKEIYKKLLDILDCKEKITIGKRDSSIKSSFDKSIIDFDKSNAVNQISLKSTSSSEFSTGDSNSNNKKRSWLEISSEKYRENLDQLKNKKFCCHTPPSKMITSPEYLEPFLHKTFSEGCSSRGFQFYSEFSNNHWMNQNFRNSMNKDPSTDNYYKLRFGDLFNSSKKYFSKNLKLNHSCHF